MDQTEVVDKIVEGLPAYAVAQGIEDLAGAPLGAVDVGGEVTVFELGGGAHRTDSTVFSASFTRT